jgi:outer membrane lipoprotein-sorting protein
MIRRTLSILVGALVVVAGVRLAAQNLDDLVAKNIQAKGGAEKLQAVQSMKQTAHLNAQGMIGTITVYGKRPNLVRQEIVVAGQTAINAFDGTTAWSINPLSGSTAPVAVTGPQADDIKMQADFDSPLVNYKAKGYQLELVGEESIAGRSVIHLKLTNADKRTQQIYLDAQTSLEMKVVGNGATGPIENELSDYRDVMGLKLPFLMKTVANGSVIGQITVDNVVLNPKIDDAIFKMPKG